MRFPTAVAVVLADLRRPDFRFHENNRVAIEIEGKSRSTSYSSRSGSSSTGSSDFHPDLERRLHLDLSCPMIPRRQRVWICVVLVWLIDDEGNLRSVSICSIGVFLGEHCCSIDLRRPVQICFSPTRSAFSAEISEFPSEIRAPRRCSLPEFQFPLLVGIVGEVEQPEKRNRLQPEKRNRFWADSTWAELSWAIVSPGPTSWASFCIGPTLGSWA
ncbi:hypothetical protein Droror1_Dr00023579 [Drosera rotundifolia]